MAAKTVSIEIEKLNEIRNALNTSLVIIDSYLNQIESLRAAKKPKKTTHKDRVNKYL